MTKLADDAMESSARPTSIDGCVSLASWYRRLMDSERAARAARRRASYDGGVVPLADDRNADYRFWHSGADEVRWSAVLEMVLAEISDETSPRLSRSVGGIRRREG